MAATLLACKECGSQYTVGHSEQGQADQLYWWGGPQSWQHEAAPGAECHATLSHYGEVKLLIGADFAIRPPGARKRTSRTEGLMDKLNLSHIQCAYCQSPGSFTSDWAQDADCCPRCHEPKLRMHDSYMT